MILCKNEITKKNIETGEMETINLAKKIDSAVFPGTQAARSSISSLPRPSASARRSSPSSSLR